MDFLNVIVNSDKIGPNDKELIFGDEEVFFVNPEDMDMFDLLVKLGSFESKGQAKKNWTKTGKEIPQGFNEFIVGKLRRCLTIWNPSKSASEYEDDNSL
jgi:hypothetical protein